ncbi:MAG: CoB--CoM heterodisulfide reductase iron-sulfur subunit A family protein [Desulfovibrio sp.]|nr:CoB--CoM heterodisulfide reductase iron-sulfur subunit A family protein [Desulfovibrio sp.]
MKLCVYCTCMGHTIRTLPEKALAAALEPHVRLVSVDRLCHAASCAASLSERVPKGQTVQVVAAACSGSARGGMALACLRSALPMARLELADIREGCAWQANTGGQTQPEEASERVAQAAALIRMAFTRLECQEPELRPHAPGELGVLVVGAGPAGLAAASTLVGLGLPVTLADRRPKPGGLAGLLGKLFPRMEQAEDVLASLPLAGITLRLGCEVISLRREDGVYVASLRRGKEDADERFDALILATGAQPVLPGTAFGAKQRKGIISQMELDTLLSAVEAGRKDSDQLAAQYVFVQCVHARSADKPYCSAICCPTAVKNALRVKNLRPQTDVTVVNRQMVMPGLALEELYAAAMRAGVRFVHVERLDDIRVQGEDSVEAVLLPSQEGGEDRRLDADVLVCSTPLQPTAASAALARQLGLRTDDLGFVVGHEPSHPLEGDAEGVFLCGSCRWPASVEQAVTQGRAAAALAARFVRLGRMPQDEIPDTRAAAHIERELCSACGRCVQACPHGACGFHAEGEVRIEAALCRRCGVCAAVCPCEAARLPLASPSPREILAAIRPSRQRSLS